jgi:hypothetical protein
MARWVRKGRGAPSPWSIHRSVQQNHPAISKLGADGVHIIDLYREQNTHPRRRRRYTP